MVPFRGYHVKHRKSTMVTTKVSLAPDHIFSEDFREDCLLRWHQEEVLPCAPEAEEIYRLWRFQLRGKFFSEAFGHLSIIFLGRNWAFCGWLVGFGWTIFGVGVKEIISLTHSHSSMLVTFNLMLQFVP